MIKNKSNNPIDKIKKLTNLKDPDFGILKKDKCVMHLAELFNNSKQIEILNKELEDKEIKINNLEKQLADLVDSQSNLSNVCEAKSIKLENLNNKLLEQNKLLTQNHNYSELLNFYEKEIETIENKYSDNLKNYIKIITEIKSNSQVINNNNNLNNDLYSNCLINNNNNLIIREDVYKKTIKKLESQLLDINKELSNCKKEYRNYYSKKLFFNKYIKQSENKISSLIKENKLENANYNNEISKLNNKIKEVECDLEKSNLKLIDLQKDNTNIKCLCRYNTNCNNYKLGHSSYSNLKIESNINNNFIICNNQSSKFDNYSIKNLNFIKHKKAKIKSENQNEKLNTHKNKNIKDLETKTQLNNNIFTNNKENKFNSVKKSPIKFAKSLNSLSENSNKYYHEYKNDSLNVLDICNTIDDIKQLNTKEFEETKVNLSNLENNLKDNNVLKLISNIKELIYSLFEESKITNIDSTVIDSVIKDLKSYIIYMLKCYKKLSVNQYELINLLHDFKDNIELTIKQNISLDNNNFLIPKDLFNRFMNDLRNICSFILFEKNPRRLDYIIIK